MNAILSSAWNDPRIFNFVIMTLYLLNSGRWALDRKWVDTIYWLCAFGITAVVTWGYRR